MAGSSRSPPPHGIFARPANLFVAGFIGTPQMNLIEATVAARHADSARFKTGSQEFSLPMNGAADGLAEGDQVIIGIRPRAFELASEPDPTTLSATLDMIEPMGAETLLHLVTDGRDLRAVVDRRTKLALGAAVHARCRPSQTHVFGADGQRLALGPAEKVPA